MSLNNNSKKMLIIISNINWALNSLPAKYDSANT